MRRMSNLVSPIRVHQSSWFFIVLLFIVLSTGLLRAQQSQDMQAYPQQPQQQQPQSQQEQPPADTGPLSADEIIQILQDNPDLLSEAKAQIVSKAQERGYTITEAEITDERLFSQIRDDDRVRLVISDELKRRGFGAPQQQQPTRQPSTSGQRQTTPGQNPNRNLPQAGAPQGERVPGSAETEKKYRDTERDKAQKLDPYRNLPALTELYTQTQSITDPSKLERFGAALFRNSTATTDKAALDVPVGSDYVLGPGDQIV